MTYDLIVKNLDYFRVNTQWQWQLLSLSDVRWSQFTLNSYLNSLRKPHRGINDFFPKLMSRFYLFFLYSYKDIFFCVEKGYKIKVSRAIESSRAKSPFGHWEAQVSPSLPVATNHNNLGHYCHCFYSEQILGGLLHYNH